MHETKLTQFGINLEQEEWHPALCFTSEGTDPNTPLMKVDLFIYLSIYTLPYL